MKNWHHSLKIYDTSGHDNLLSFSADLDKFQITLFQENDSKNVSIDPNLIASTLKQLNTSLTLDEREKLNAAIHGYLLVKSNSKFSLFDH